ncbi:MAG: TonB-dependent receptor [Bacteroidota bacterium]|nr:TonB-dependent receptor [Bacteroidota bacterium]
MKKSFTKATAFDNQFLRKALIMTKIYILILLCSIYTAKASDSYAQNVRVNLDLNNVSLNKVIKAIKEQTKFEFAYDANLDQLILNKVSINAKDEKIDNVLTNVLKGTNINFRVIDRIILLSTKVIKKNSGIENGMLLQQQKLIGSVTDAQTGESLPGVSVLIKGTTKGTVTDKQGKFSFTNIEPNAILVVSFVGYEKQEITINNTRQISIKLLAIIQKLDEVVVIGYGTQKRSNISGSIATVKTSELIAQPTSDLQGMLRGQVAGLNVTVSDARPGGNSAVLLRGERSLMGSNSPLYVVDGIPISTSINDLNINDIETISVLKDASSQAIYGARASNGVILITTKRGTNTNNKINLSYQGYVSYQNVNPNFEVFSPTEYIQLRRDAYTNDLGNATNSWKGTPLPDNQMFTPLEQQYINNKAYVNWLDYAFKKDVPLTKHDFSLSGGNENTQYSASFGYYYQDGVRYSSDLKSYTGKLTLDQIISKTFKTGLSVYYITKKQDEETNPWLSFITFDPIAQLYDASGNLILFPTGDGKSINPLWYQKTRQNSNKTDRVIINGYLQVTPGFLPGLQYKINASLDNRNSEANNFQSFIDQSSLTNGYANITFSNAKDYLVENLLTYDKTINKNHKVNLTLMQSIEPNNSYSTSSIATQLGNDFFGVNSLGSAIQQKVGRSLTDRKMVSFMGRLNYSLKDKYLLNFAIRDDGSSVFGANNKWGYFPSAALAWNINKESFMKKMNWLNEAKLRVSYGQIGNQAIGPYGSLATAANAFYVSNGSALVGYTPGNSLPNPNLKWETTTTLNTGFDFGLFNHRLTGTIEYYRSNTTNLLVSRQVPSVLGYSTMPSNLGEIQNSGIEATFTGFIISNKDFNWSITANFSKNQNKIVKGVLRDPTSGKYIDDVANLWFIDQPINVYYDYKFSGIWQIGDDIAHSPQPSARPGDPKVADIDGDGKITPADRIIIKQDPEWVGSLSTSIRYKGIEFSADLYTVQGTRRLNPFLEDVNYGGSYSANVGNSIKVNYWTPDNPINTNFRPTIASGSAYRSTLAYQNSSYIRLRTLTVAYELPKKWLQAIGLSKVKVYVAGDNLWTDTKYQSYSPEANADAYPETKNYTLGMTINF